MPLLQVFPADEAADSPTADSQKNDQNKEQKNEQENEQTEAQPEFGVLWVSDNGSCYHRDRLCAALAHVNVRKKTQCSKCFRAKRE